MTTAELASRLADMDVPADYYCLNGEQHEALCLLVEGPRWKVFLSERGVRYEERTFTAESEACEYFLARILQLWRH